MMDNKDLIKWLKQNKFSLVTDGQNHYAVYWASGELAGRIANSPHGGNRSMQNTIAALRRAGVPLPRK